MTRSRFMGMALILTASILVLGMPVHAAPVVPISYDMLNGETGSYNYWDESYTGTGNKTLDKSPLSGGLGDLTDGYIATQNWYIVEAPVGAGPYVGWQSINPTITFHFGGPVTINSITFYVDDANGAGGVYVPSGFTIGGTTTYVADPAGSTPTAYTVTGPGAIDENFSVTILRRSNNWVFVSEIAFDGTTPVPLPASFLLLAPALAGLAVMKRKFRK